MLPGRALLASGPLAAALIAGGVAGCGSGRSVAPVDAAAARWQATKSTCTSYHYDRKLSGSGFNNASITTVQIVDDVPVLRWFILVFPGGIDGSPSEEWRETGGDIGAHADGFPAETVEQLLAECKHVIQDGPTGVAPGPYNVLTEFNDRGVPLTCLATPTNCIDDCASGISMAGFSCGALSLSSPDGGSG